MLKAAHLWLPGYLSQPAWTPMPGQTTHLMIAVCDHFEPLHHTDHAGALERLALWRRQFPQLIAPHRDADGVAPRHTFFYPVEQYHPELLEPIAQMCAETGSEVEIHLHHADDTEAGLTEALDRGKEDLRRHGLLGADANGQIRYGFIHGNWALDNSHPAGRHCGVNNELAVLESTGCYADFTMPSAPDPTQTRTVNRIYYATDTPAPKSHDHGQRATVRAVADQSQPDGLLLVQGPLGLNWERRKWGCLPRVENADLTGANPPTLDRVRVWLRCGVTVAGRPDWVFAKLHTHGAIPRNSGMLLGDGMRKFHEALLREYNDGQRFCVHYVTAREMVNIIHAAEDGQPGQPGQYRNYRCAPPPLLAPTNASR